MVRAVRAISLRNSRRPRQSEQAAIRRIRLASQDLRTIGLNLQGIADHLASPAPTVPNDLAVVAAAIFDIADDLHEFTMQAGPAHVLNQEPLNLARALDGALTDASNAIRPGRREWRVAASLTPVSVKADRRALRYVLTRVLIVLVRSTGPQGAIDIELEPHADGLALLMTADASTPLAGMAGSLVTEHGGSRRGAAGARARSVPGARGADRDGPATGRGSEGAAHLPACCSPS